MQQGMKGTEDAYAQLPTSVFEKLEVTDFFQKKKICH